MFVELSRTFKFDACHHLPKVRFEHKCSRLHGHTYRVEIAIAGECDEQMGWLIDYAEIKRVIEPVIDVLDHSNLNEIPGLENPTSEILSRWVWDKLIPNLPFLTAVTIHESESSKCTYRG